MVEQVAQGAMMEQVAQGAEQMTTIAVQTILKTPMVKQMTTTAVPTP